MAQTERLTMKKSLVSLIPLVMTFYAVAARADVFIPFTGSGSSTANWYLNDGFFGVPSPDINFQDIVRWHNPTGVPYVNEFTITFTGLPAGLTIDPASLDTFDCANLSVVSGATFCNLNGDHPEWPAVLSNGNDTITFTARPGSSLIEDDFFFFRIFFTAPVDSVSFTGGWSSPVPEPRSLSLMGTLLGLYAIGFLRMRRRQTVARVSSQTDFASQGK